MDTPTLNTGSSPHLLVPFHCDDDSLAHSAQAGFRRFVCIHGHGGDRYATYNPESIYKGFATELARRGYVTIAADVGQHQVYEQGRTLMGERLWDLMRCVDLLVSRPEVDKTRIGCAAFPWAVKWPCGLARWIRGSRPQ